VARTEHWGIAVWTSPTRVAFASDARTISVHQLAEGFAREATIALPPTLGMPTERRDQNDDGFDRQGVHAVALHPTKLRVAIGGMDSKDGQAIRLLDGDGRIVSRRDFEERWPRALVFTQRTLWAFCAAEEEDLWAVALDP